MEFRHSCRLTENTPAADGTVEVDLGTSPISHLILRLECLNLTADTKATLDQILGALESFEVLMNGAAVISLRGMELFRLSGYLCRHEPWQLNEINLENAVRSIIMVVPFGRKLFNPNECYPETKSGDLVCKMKVDIDDTGYDGLKLHLEQVELPGAKPTRHLKYTEKLITGGATGEDEVTLPRGNQIAGIMFWATTVPTTTAWTCDLNDFSLKLNNEEKFYVETYWEALHGAGMLRLSPPVAWSEALLMENSATAYTQNADTGVLERVASDFEHYSFMDFSPNDEDDYLINSADLGAFSVRINYGGTGAARCVPVELKAVG